MVSITTLLLATELALSGATPPAQVRNGGFEQTCVRAASDSHVAAMREMGWAFRSPLEWPTAPISGVLWRTGVARRDGGCDGVCGRSTRDVVGGRGVATSDIKPHGRADFDGRIADVKSATFIPADAHVVVTGIDDGVPVVERLA